MRLKNIGFIVFVMALAVSINLFAGTTGQIRGHVIDKKTGEGIPYAAVQIVEAQMGSYTDENGDFYIMQVPVGTYTLIVQMQGYKKMTVKGVEVRADFTTEQNFELVDEAIQGEEIEVRAKKPLIDAQETTSITSTNAAQIENMAVENVDDIVNKSAGVVDGHFRGGRDDEVAYSVDGVSINNPISGGKAIDPPTTMLQAVDVITGAYNAEYGDAISGVVNAVIKEGGPKIAIDAGLKVKRYINKYAQPYDRIIVDTAYVSASNDTIIQTHTETRLEDSYLLERGFHANIGGPLFSDKVKFFVGFEGRLWPGAVPELPATFSESKADTSFAKPLPMTYRIFDISYQDEEPNETAIWLKNYRSDDASKYIGLYEKYIVSPDKFLDNKEYTVAGKLTFLPISALKIDVSLQHGYSNVMPHSEARLYLTSEGDRSNFHFMPFSLYRIETKANFYGIGATYSLSSNAFVELKATLSSIETLTGGYDYDNDKWMDPGVAVYENGTYGHLEHCDYWPIQGGGYSTLFDFYKYFWHSGTYPYYDKQESNGSTFTGSLTWQINKMNRMKTGFKLAMNKVKEDKIDTPNPFAVGATSGNLNSRIETHWDLGPMKFAYYIQNTLEYEGMILNAGVRFENFNPDAEMWKNPKNPDDGKITAESKFTVSPRLGISHPITDKSVFYFNYAHLYQNPYFDLLYRNYLKIISTNESGYTLGNPELSPEKSVIYEIGYDQQIGEDFVVKNKLYYKELNNLVAVRTYYPSSGMDNISGISSPVYYNSFTSKDYGSIRGIEINFERRMDDYWGLWISYSYSLARGSAADPFQNRGKNFYVMDRREVPLSYDRTHSFNVNLGLHIPKDTFGSAFLDDWNFNMNFLYTSGLPYTKNKVAVISQTVRLLKDSDTNEERMPGKTTVDLKIRKSFNIGPVSATFYVQVNNLFNTINPTFVYSTTGEYDNADPEDFNNPNIALPTTITTDSYQVYEDKVNWMRMLREKTPANYEDLRSIRVGLNFSFN